jgi:hypothetical protein
MILSEPTTLATDWLLAAVSLVLGLRLRSGGRSDRRRPRRLWSAAFLVGAGAAFVGGIVHGFAPSLGPAAHAFLWIAVLAGTGVTASLILGGTVLATTTGPLRVALLSAAAGQLVAYLVVVGVSASTRHAIWHAALAIALTFLLALAAAGRDRALFHNDVCHGLQAFSLWPFYQAGLGLRDATALTANGPAGRSGEAAPPAAVRRQNGKRCGPPPGRGREAIMKTTILTVLAACAFTAAALAQAPADCSGHNVLTPAEKAAGWELLFDGKSTAGWHGYNKQPIPAWVVDGCLLKSAGTEGNYGSDLRADLVTDKEYTDFELVLDWKATKGGNSGVMYGVVEDAKYKAAWMTGPEYQLIDDVGFPEKLEEWQKAGANYAMHVADEKQKVLKPVGEWNQTRILVHGPRVEHWLNGKKVVSFERWTPEWNALRDSGKWKEAPDYGKFKTGRLVLQDHGSVFWFRNVKVRPIR